ncbi:phosphoinositide phospholipase C, putative [Bodo saltans]|uniref:Phosphoinositide phospholipase C, putative n=1 Tax=Bodo saltans TaxID=75058 RepID=A0A0S4KHF2_BODSA|nr:phosphoinositide phospholipase C, putative [Bodo saltans]|eukprot:CUI15126.1 phosphoinositide phospholipase C, putative [Bodo saltans]
MGCKNSKPKVIAEIKAANTTPPSSRPASPQTKKDEPAELFIRSFLLDANAFFNSLPDSDSLRIAQATVFLNSVAEVLRITFRMKIVASSDLLRRLFDGKMPILADALNKIEDHCTDDGYMRLLNGWETQNPEHKTVVSGKVLQAVLRAVEVHKTGLPEGGFGSILTHFTSNYMSNLSAVELFTQFSPDGQTLPKEQFLNFLRAAQGQEHAGERTALEKIRSRFGGVVTKYNFNSYIGGLITNSALDPPRASNVWQDMTQPLPHYLVSTAHVDSEAELVKAIRENVRALVVTCTKKDNGEIYSGSCRLSLILDTIKQSGFKDSAYPIILCFNPSHKMDIEVQESVAQLLKSKLGNLLARGMMFEGAMINDPNFSPAALQRKVLLMGNQAPLKPFVGFHVADMNREGLGVRVTDVQGSTPASKAGIARDDWLTHINGAQIRNKQHLREQLALFSLGDEFTMKKENLDEVRIVVGGAVSAGDSAAAHSLSDLIYLKFVGPYDQSHTYFPWESSSTTSESLNDAPSPNKHDLNDRFLFVSQPSESSTCGADKFVGNATSRGAQFVDAGGRVDTHIWARGLFTDNAHCGYLLKSSDGEAIQLSEVTLRLISGPVKAGSLPPTKATVRMHGAGKSSQLGAFTFSFAGCEESSVAVVEMEYANGSTYVSSFPPLLLRGGYRVLPAVELAEELLPSPITQGVFCCVGSSRDLSGTYAIPPAE